VSEPLIVKFYRRLPQPAPNDDQELWQAGVQEAMRDFRQAIRNNYTESTLQRLLCHPQPMARRAAVLALGLIGTMDSNAAMAAALRDTDSLVLRFAQDAMWEIWLRGTTIDDAWQLRQTLQLNDFSQKMAALNDLIQTAPEFAEAYNQRAILYFSRGEFGESASDCKLTLRLNPYHFAAAAAMGQCYLKLRKPRAALRAFRQALEINPGLDDLQAAVQALQEALGE
jgi:tetratricopeptide (TPR) repeat protein